MLMKLYLRVLRGRYIMQGRVDSFESVNVYCQFTETMRRGATNYEMKFTSTESKGIFYRVILRVSDDLLCQRIG